MRLVTRELGLVDYQTTFDDMRGFTQRRDEHTPDELWLLQHPQVFTQGRAGKAEHLLAPGDIPVIQIDRGGQVTYHGPGQLLVYLLLDIGRRDLGVRALVTLIETTLIALLARYGIAAAADPEAPGVYVDKRKIASLGLRVRKGLTYHGLSLNVDMDLEPFQRINPCGYQGLEVTSMASLLPGEDVDIDTVGRELLAALEAALTAAPPMA